MNITLEDAVKMIDNICAQVSLNREGHIRLQMAIKVIKDNLPKEPEAREEKKSE